MHQLQEKFQTVEEVVSEIHDLEHCISIVRGELYLTSCPFRYDNLLKHIAEMKQEQENLLARLKLKR